MSGNAPPSLPTKTSEAIRSSNNAMDLLNAALADPEVNKELSALFGKPSKASIIGAIAGLLSSAAMYYGLRASPEVTTLVATAVVAVVGHSWSWLTRQRDKVAAIQKGMEP